MQKREMCYSGKAKSLFASDDPNILIAEFRDDTSAFDGVKKEKLAHKGLVNNYLNEFIMLALMEAGVPTHHVARISDTETTVKRLRMIPIECVVRNIAAGSLCKRLGIEAKTKLSPPLYENFLKNDELHDPLITTEHALTFGWATMDELNAMKALTLKINQVLTKLLADAGLILVDAKFEFGVSNDGAILLGDEISPDSCRIWDAKTQEKLDKDRFRQDLGDVVGHYQEIARRLGVTLPAHIEA